MIVFVCIVDVMSGIMRVCTWVCVTDQVNRNARLVEVKRLVCSRYTTPSNLREFVVRNMVQRNGNVYGAQHGRASMLVFRDIDLLQRDDGASAEQTHEVLRLLLEKKQWFKADKSGCVCECVRVFGNVCVGVNICVYVRMCVCMYMCSMYFGHLAMSVVLG